MKTNIALFNRYTCTFKENILSSDLKHKYWIICLLNASPYSRFVSGLALEFLSNFSMKIIFI